MDILIDFFCHLEDSQQLEERIYQNISEFLIPNLGKGRNKYLRRFNEELKNKAMKNYFDFSFKQNEDPLLRTDKYFLSELEKRKEKADEEIERLSQTLEYFDGLQIEKRENVINGYVRESINSPEYICLLAQIYHIVGIIIDSRHLIIAQFQNPSDLHKEDI